MTKVESLNRRRADKELKERIENFNPELLKYEWTLPSGNTLDLTEDDLLFLERIPLKYAIQLRNSCSKINHRRTGVEIADKYKTVDQVRFGQPHVAIHHLSFGRVVRATPERHYVSPRGRREGETMILFVEEVAHRKKLNEQRWPFDEFARIYRREIVNLETTDGNP